LRAGLGQPRALDFTAWEALLRVNPDAVFRLSRLAGRAMIAKRRAVTFLASNRAAYITGQTLFVDGGWTSL